METSRATVSLDQPSATATFAQKENSAFASAVQQEANGQEMTESLKQRADGHSWLPGSRMPAEHRGDGGAAKRAHT